MLLNAAINENKFLKLAEEIGVSINLLRDAKNNELLVPSGIVDPIPRYIPLRLFLDEEQRRAEKDQVPFNRYKEEQRQLYMKRCWKLDGKGAGKANREFELHWADPRGYVEVPEDESD